MLEARLVFSVKELEFTPLEFETKELAKNG